MYSKQFKLKKKYPYSIIKTCVTKIMTSEKYFLVQENIQILYFKRNIDYKSTSGLEITIKKNKILNSLLIEISNDNCITFKTPIIRHLFILFLFNICVIFIIENEISLNTTFILKNLLLILIEYAILRLYIYGVLASLFTKLKKELFLFSKNY